jgi:pimeloyl-ACP methyl ester carboxylesterase
MHNAKPTIVLVHGAFAESSSWNAVIELLLAQDHHVVAVANPLRSLAGDAAYVADVLRSIEGPIVLVGHSYGGMVITQAAVGIEAVQALVYVAAFTPDQGESAFDLSARFPGSTLGDALTAYPVSTGGNELAIRQDVFHQQFAADVPAAQAALMASTQRPVTQAALTDPLPTGTPAWKGCPSWFILGTDDLNIPAELVRFFADRSGSRGTTEVAGGSHAISVSNPGAVAATILDACLASTSEPVSA